MKKMINDKWKKEQLTATRDRCAGDHYSSQYDHTTLAQWLWQLEYLRVCQLDSLSLRLGSPLTWEGKAAAAWI